MAMTLQQQIVTATRLQTEHQLELWTAIHLTLLDSVDKLAALNLQAVREALGESSALASRCLDAGGPQEASAAASGTVPPSVERLGAYTRQLTDIANEMRLGLGKLVQDEMADVQRRAAVSMQEMVSQQDVGSDTLLPWLQSAVDA